MAINYKADAESKAWLVGGTLYWSEIDENDKPVGGFRSLGYCDSVDLSAEQTTVDLYASLNGSRNKVRSVITENNTSISLVLRDGQAKNTSLILFGDAIANVEATAHEETIVAELGKTVPLQKIYKDPSAVVVTSSDGSKNYVAGENYVMNNGSIYFIEDQTGATDQIAAKDEIKVSGDVLAEEVIEGFTHSEKTGCLYFEGENLAEKGEIVKVWIYKVSLTPAASYQIYSSEDFGSFQLDGSALSSKNSDIAAGKSKIYKEVRQVGTNA